MLYRASGLTPPPMLQLAQVREAELSHPVTEARSAVTIWVRTTLRGWNPIAASKISFGTIDLSAGCLGQFRVANGDGMDMQRDRRMEVGRQAQPGGQAGFTQGVHERQLLCFTQHHTGG